MTKEIKELLVDELKALTLKFDFINDTSEDIWYPINASWFMGFSKVTTPTYTYMVFRLLNRQTNYVVRNLFIRREFDTTQNIHIYNILCDILFKGEVRESSTLDNFDDLPYNDLEEFLDYHLTETQQRVLHHALGRL